MKALRVTVLMACLLIGATSRPVPVADNTSPTIAAQGAGDCYWLNGVWFCER